MENDNRNKAIEITMEFEGGFCVDQGGETNYGISSNAYPGIDVKRLTKEEAVVLYYERWEKCKAEKMPWPLSLLHFDNSVNSGISGAGKMLQRAVNNIIASRLLVDGIVGNKTLAAVDQVKVSGRMNLLIDEYLLERADHFTKLAAFEKHRESFLGWIRRLMKLRSIVLVESN